MGAHRFGDLVTLREQLLCIVARDDRLHYLIPDGGQHPLIPVCAQVLRRRDQG
jgi:hypothetical protein